MVFLTSDLRFCVRMCVMNYSNQRSKLQNSSKEAVLYVTILLIVVGCIVNVNNRKHEHLYVK